MIVIYSRSKTLKKDKQKHSSSLWGLRKNKKKE